MGPAFSAPRVEGLPMSEVDENLSGELRIHQTVLVARGMPVLVVGNPVGVALLAMLDWRHFLSSYAVVPAAFLIALIIPMAVSYVRVRGKQRPTQVSERRIRRIEIHSLLMGLSWAGITALYIPAVGAIEQVITVWLALFMCYGAVALVGSIPKAALGYVLPTWLASYLALMIDGSNDRFIMSLIMWIGLIAVVQTCRQNWSDFRSNVILIVERARIMREYLDKEGELHWREAETAAKERERQAELAEKSNALEQLSNQLAKYLSPQVYESIFSGKQEVKVASNRKKLTVFFSDIANFTETADRLQSEELTQLLNRYLTEMSRIALDHGATIDKYVGDAILIFFGDPETKGVKEDATACVEMAIAMRKRLHDLEGVWRESGLEQPWQCRIGIHTDYCTVGNFGSEDRMDYTIIGGGVNTASRLETAADPGEILISYETFAHVRDRIYCEKHGQISVKGIAYPVATYRVIDSHENIGREGKQIREDHPNVKLDIDLSTMSADDRTAAAAILRRALDMLTAEDEPAEPKKARQKEAIQDQRHRQVIDRDGVSSE